MVEISAQHRHIATRVSGGKSGTSMVRVRRVRAARTPFICSASTVRSSRSSARSDFRLAMLRTWFSRHSFLCAWMLWMAGSWRATMPHHLPRSPPGSWPQVKVALLPSILMDGAAGRWMFNRAFGPP